MNRSGRRSALSIVGCATLLGVTAVQAQHYTDAQRAFIAEVERRNRFDVSVPAQMLLIRDLPPINPATGRPYPTIGPGPDRPIKGFRDHLLAAQREADSAGQHWNNVRNRAVYLTAGSIGTAAAVPPLAPFAAVAGVISSVSGQIAEAQANKSGVEYYNSVKRLVEGYAATLSEEDRTRAFQGLGLRNGENVRQQALTDIGAGLDKLYPELNLKGLPKDGVVAATPAMFEAIREGLINARMLQMEEVAELSQRISNADRVMADSQQAFASLSQTVKQTSNAVDDLQAIIPELKSSLHVTNAVLLSRMSASEQLNALEAGIDIGIDVPTKKKLMEDLKPRVIEEQRVQRVRLAEQTANDVAMVASTAVNLARAVGVDVPPDVDRAMAIGHSLFSVGAGFAINPITGIGALNGALGAFAGPQSPASDPKVLEALTDIKEELGEIKKLQKDTLAKLDALDAKLTEQHTKVMEQLERIADQTSTLVAFAYQTVWNSLDQCARFERRMAPFSRGGAGRYDALVDFFNSSRNMQEEYAACRQALNRFSGLPNQTPHTLFTQGLPSEGNISTVTHYTFYRPALDLMNRAYNGWTDWCDDHVRLLTTLSPSMQGHDEAMAACNAPQIPRMRIRLTFADIPLISYRDTLNRLIHHDALLASPSPSDERISKIAMIDVFRRYHSLIAPMHELMPPQHWETRLLTSDELEQRLSTSPTSSEAEERSANLLDLVALAAAQESMMAGVGMFPRLWEAIEQTLQNDEAAGGKARIALDFGNTLANLELLRTCDLSGLPVPDSSRLACLFDRHPQMLANTMVWRVRKSMQEGDANGLLDPAKLAVYGMAHVHHSQDLLNRATGAGSAAIRWALDGAGVYGFVFRRDVAADKQPGEGAYFKFRSLDGSDVYLRAPSEREVASGLIRYRPQAYELMQTRMALHEEYLFYRLHNPIGDTPALSPDERGFIAYHALNGIPR